VNVSGPVLDATCPRCGGGFECGANAGQCACFGMQLTDTLRAELTARYPGRCLCLRCLRELLDGERPPQAVMGGAAASG
jgi:hypothetical protein